MTKLTRAQKLQQLAPLKAYLDALLAGFRDGDPGCSSLLTARDLLVAAYELIVAKPETDTVEPKS